MEIQCPNCSSRFNLADSVAKPGSKLRCSVCKEIFQLPTEEEKENKEQKEQKPVKVESETDQLDLDKKPPKSSKKTKKSKIKTIIFVLLTAVAILGAWYYINYIHNAEVVSTTLSLEEKVSRLTMSGVRQYYVINEKIGNIFVIEGQVVNGFAETKELIEVEATLYGAAQKALISKTQLAGTMLSLFQLQVLGEKELESFLNNKIEVLINNTNIRSGAEVPFMVIFYAPPEGITEFGVKIVDVQSVVDTVE